MVRWGAYVLIATGVLHMLLLGHDALPAIGGWLQFDLWTPDHTTRPVAQRDLALLRAEHAFWSTIGGAAIPLIILGFLILWLRNRGYPVPDFVGWAIGLWALACSAIIQPSGFPVLLVVAGLLVFGVRARTSVSRPEKN